MCDGPRLSNYQELLDECQRHIPPFTAYGQWGKGLLDVRVFEQDKFWIDYSGMPHRLEEMPSDYLLNVLLFLNAANLRTKLWLQCENLAACNRLRDLVLGGNTCETCARQALALGPIFWMGPSRWMESSPLVRRLRTLAHEPAPTHCQAENGQHRG